MSIFSFSQLTIFHISVFSYFGSSTPKRSHCHAYVDFEFNAVDNNWSRRLYVPLEAGTFTFQCQMREITPREQQVLSLRCTLQGMCNAFLQKSICVMSYSPFPLLEVSSLLSCICNLFSIAPPEHYSCLYSNCTLVCRMNIQLVKAVLTECVFFCNISISMPQARQTFTR